MPEDRQFRQRLEAWHAELKNQIMTPVMPVTFSGCPANGRLSVSEAEKLPFRPMAPGEKWGAHREYRWFSARITLPEECAGKRIVLLSAVGGEQIVYLNGAPMGSVDKQHGCVTLFASAPRGGSYHILIESYAGNGPRLENSGPCPPERAPVPPTPAAQCMCGESCIALFDENAYQLFMDADTLIRLMPLLPQTGLRRQRIAEALRRFTHILDFELPKDARAESITAAREALRPVLESRNGSTAPELHIFGQSHIDLAWLWPMEETFHKAARTYSNQIRLMEAYPEYRFLACEPALLDMLKEQDPALFALVLDRIRAGQIFADGAFYVECDTNIPSGESLIRQLLWGKKWFRDNLNTVSRTAWQPDTFGFSPCLPQILKAFRVPYFATQKLLRADPECERFPYQDFIWEGPDGSRVQALSFFKNNARTDPENLAARWDRDRSQADGISCLLYPFGYGDGGGGADRDMLEYLRRETDLEGLPRTAWRTLEEHFEITRESAEKNIWRGELYLAWHRGTYTVQRRTKTALYALEQKLHDAEFLLAACGEGTRAKHKSTVNAATRTLLIHQFHDIAAGACIREVHEEAVRALEQAEKSVDSIIRDLIKEACRVTEKENAVYALNTLSFARQARITLPGGQEGTVMLPPYGGRTVTAGDLEAAPGTVQVRPVPGGYGISNGVLCFTLHPDGTIGDMTDLRNGLALQEKGQLLNALRLYKNVEPVYDAWELSRDCAQDRTDAVRPLGITLAGENTPLVTVSARYMIGSSPCEERITVAYGADTVAFEIKIDWQERHKLLKAHFETNIQCDDAIHGMQMCHIARPAHRSTAFAKDRYETCNHHYTALFESARGAVLMNRAIWGISCDHGAMALTLLRAPCAPDDTCDRGPQTFAFAFRAADGPFALSRVTEEAYAFAHPPLVVPGAGRDFAGVTAEGAVIETVKPAEDGGGTVLRLWEHRGTRAMVTLRVPEKRKICACDIDEGNVTLLTDGDTAVFPMRAFEIRTLMLMP